MSKLKLIRGKRIEDQLKLMEDMSVNDIEQKTTEFNPATTKRQNATTSVQIQNMKLMASAPSGVLEIQAIVTNNGKRYESILLFSGVDYQGQDVTPQQDEPQQEEPQQEEPPVDDEANLDAARELDPNEEFKESFVTTLEADEMPNTGGNVTFKGADGKDYHIAPIALNATNAKVRCTCLDFRWRFSMQHQAQGTLHGPGPGIYKKKTDREPNNPKNIPGVCKHLLKLAQELKQNGILR